MSARRFVWFLGVLLAASASHASEEWAFMVYQPLDLPNSIVSIVSICHHAGKIRD